MRPLLLYVVLSALLFSGCSHHGRSTTAGPSFAAANEFFSQGNYEASLREYEKLIEKEPRSADRVLFEMGIIYAHPRNERKSHEKAMECFRKIISDYHDSAYRRDSQMLILQIRNVTVKDSLIADQQTQIDSCRQGIKNREREIRDLVEKIRNLERKVFDFRKEPVDKILIEKKKRRLTLLAKGESIKTYKIALGGNPVGPKEREGDGKTPEGTYTIQSRNRRSDYHLSLRISYPNEKDRKRAQELGVSPGGDIMIHGIENSLSWIGSLHTEIDWTRGCIAVTNEEMEEIARLAPDGTVVEIKP